MIGYFFSTATHSPADLWTARDTFSRFAAAEAATQPALVASPTPTSADGLDPGLSRVSILAPLQEGSLQGAMIVPPIRYFRDAFGTALIAHVHNAVQPGGYLLLPFLSSRAAERVGYPTLPWLEAVIGRCERSWSRQQLALFRRGKPLGMARSLLSCFVEDGYALATEYLSDQAQAASADYLATCADFLEPPIRPIQKADVRSETEGDKTAEFNRFFANMSYRVMGASYKVQGLRRFIERYLPGRSDLRVIDLGGSAGNVCMELLLTCDAVERAVNCEPLANNLPLTRWLYRHFEPHLKGRYKHCPSVAQDYPFAEPCDVVSAFGSLLFLPRDMLDTTLGRAWDALRPGGILVVHENIRRPRFQQTNYYGKMFTVAELESHLSRFGRIEYYRSTDIEPMMRLLVGDRTVFRVIRKG